MPLNPMKARAKRPATTRAIGIPSIPLGTRIKLSCSRKPAKTISGTTLFDLADYDCASLNKGTTGFCCATGDGNCTEDITTQSPTMQAFRTAYSGHEYWTSTVVDACNVSRVYMYTGSIKNQHKEYSFDFHALCR